jgi:hypothetical protein
MTNEVLTQANDLKNDIDNISASITTLSNQEINTSVLILNAITNQYAKDFELKDTDTVNALNLEIETLKTSYLSVLSERKTYLQTQFDNLGGQRGDQ